jgi:glycosyltransferase involved in cell wall biosynthesis
MKQEQKKIILFANTDWYLYNFRLSLARQLADQNWEVVLASPPGPYVDRFAKEGFRWESMPLSRRGLRVHQEFLTLLHLIRFYFREKPDIVHHFTIKPVFYGSLAARISRIPAVVNSITGLGYFFLSDERRVVHLRRYVIPLYRLALASRRSRIIFENSTDLEIFLNRGLARSNQVRLIEGVGVDLDRFVPTEEHKGSPVTIMAARMLWDKGAGEFVQAARQLKEKFPSARFALVGAPDPGNPSTIPEDQLYHWVQEGVIEWWGHRLDMPEVFRDAHIVALPSYSEGLATVLLEAAASARPIVTTDIPGCKEVVEDNVTGLLVAVGDHVGLAQSLERLIKDEALRKEMGRAGRRLVEQRFNQQVVNEKTIDIYQELFSN